MTFSNPAGAAAAAGASNYTRALLDVLGDRVFGYRLRMVLTEDRPSVQGYDQDAWART